MEVIFVTVVFIAGCIVGLMGYRYALKRDPEKLEQWAKEAKSLGDRVRK